MKIPVSIWSDIACPWCYVGMANLNAAIELLKGESDAVELQLRWRAFELDPRPREPSTLNYAERLAAKYQRSVEQAQEMLDTMTQAIADAGGRADFNKVIAANTFRAHQLIQWAGDTDQRGETSGAQHQLTDALKRTYLGDGLNLGEDSEMLSIVAALGLDEAAAKEALDSERFASTVRGDEEEAEQLGIRGVPFFVIGGYGLSGAQPPSTLVEVIHKVMSDQAESQLEVS